MKRLLFPLLEDHLKAKQISLIIGARQVGKTTLLKQIQKLLTTKKESVFYITLEDREILDLLNKNAKNLLQIISNLDSGKRIYLLIDEIQYLDDPSNFLKYHYDTYLDKIKFIVTGSSSFYIDKSFKDSLAGRKRIFELDSLSLKEVLHFKGEDKLIPYLNSGNIPLLYRDKIKQYYYDYLIYGGYPEVVLSNDNNEKQLILKELVDSYAKKDIVESHLSNGDSYFKIMRLLASQIGSLLNVNSLASDVKLDNKTENTYLWVMRKLFHIYLLSPFYKNVSSELKKMPKIFYADLGIRNYLVNNFSPIALREDKGDLLENYVANLLKSKYNLENLKFWRTQSKQEVDFVVQDQFSKYLAYEVKFQRKSFKQSKYSFFMKSYPEISLECIDLESAIVDEF